MKYYITIALVMLVVVFFGLWRTAARQQQRASNNFTAVTSQAKQYVVRDSLLALSKEIMELKIDELRNLRADDAQLIGQMKIRLARTQSIAKIETIGRYEFSVAGDTAWRAKDNYMSFQARKSGEKLDVNIKIRDTIVQVLHRVPRFKIFGIYFGTKGVRQEIVSKNPHTEIVAAEFLKIIR